MIVLGALRSCLLTIFTIVAVITLVVNQSAHSSAIYMVDSLSTYEFWRVLSGHLTHASLSHAIFNLALFIPFSFAVERSLGSIQYLLVYCLLAMSVILGIHLCHDSWSSYSGLSGVIYGLISFYLLDHSRPPRYMKPQALSSILSRSLVILLLAKSSLEVTFGGWLFASGELEAQFGLRYLAASHLFGCIAGISCWFVFRWEQAKKQISRLNVSRPSP